MRTRWGERPLDGLTRRDVIDMVEDIVDRGTPEAARAALAQCKALLNWCVARDMMEHSPADRVNPSKIIGEKRPRQRVLTDYELRAFWKATERLGYPFGPMCRLLLLLTGTRKDEAAGARWREFDIERKAWIVPPERFKSNASHLVPLPDDAAALIEALPRFNKGDHMFSTAFGKVPVSGYLPRRGSTSTWSRKWATPPYPLGFCTTCGALCERGWHRCGCPMPQPK